MTEPRLSTVFDYSDLRLHPNGTRVYQKASNRRPVLAKVTVQDARANWIAKDAGGSTRIAKYRKRASKEGGDGDIDAEVIDISRELGETTGIEKFRDDEGVVPSSGGEGSEASQLSRKRKAKKLPDQRKFKRQKFEAGYEYLEANEPRRTKSVDTNAAVSDVQSLGNIFPTEPSPDLLKVIHRFASEFYTERGQLLNISREYRKERKQRALARKAKQLDGGPSRASKKKATTSRSQSPGSSADSDDDFSEHDSDDLSEDSKNRQDRKGKGKEKERHNREPLSMESPEEGEEDEDEEEEEENEDDKAYKDDADEIESFSDADSKKSTRGKRRSKPSDKEKRVYTDMYKVFDGSAMMALGMLVQEHIASLLNPEVPEAWIKGAKGVYTEDGSSDDEEDVDRLQPEEEGIHEEEDEKDEEDEDDELDEDGEEDEDDEADEDDEKQGNDEENDEEGDEDEEDELLDDDDEEGQQDEGADSEVKAKDDRFEHGNENEHDVNPYLPASFRTQNDTLRVPDQSSNTSGERAPGASGPILEQDDDDPIEYTSDESMRSDDTVHSDSEDEYV